MAGRPRPIRHQLRRIVVTGASGFIGSSLVRRLRDFDCTIVRVVRTPGETPSDDGVARVETIVGDVRERRVWEETLDGADLVYHLAAQTSGAAAHDDPVRDFEHNVLPTLLMLETCRRRAAAPVIVFASTATVAGIAARMPVSERVHDRPITVYDVHKKMAEQYLEFAAGHGQVRTAALRLANIYGPGPSGGQPDRGVLNQMIAKALDGNALTIHGRGTVLRDYLYIDDAVGAFVAASDHIDRLNGRHFVIGSGRGHTVAAAIRLVAARVAAETGARAHVEHVTPAGTASAIDRRNFVADSRRFRRLTGWRPRVALAEGIDRTIASLTGS